jgi:hypothetical protein
MKFGSVEERAQALVAAAAIVMHADIACMGLAGRLEGLPGRSHSQCLRSWRAVPRRGRAAGRSDPTGQTVSLAIGLALLGFAAGIWFADLTWRWKIHDRARMGIRLAVDGRLYTVAEDVPALTLHEVPDDEPDLAPPEDTQ